MALPNAATKDFTPMTAESAAKFFDELGAGSSKQNNQQNNNNNVEEQKVGDDQRDEDG